MKYCNNCGEILKDRAKICWNCGMELPGIEKLTQEQYDTIFVKKKASIRSKKAVDITPRNPIPGRKSMTLAIILSIIFPGLGVLYAGNKKLGIYVTIGFFIAGAIDVVFKLVLNNFFVGIPFYLGIYVWGIRSAIKSIKIFNQPLVNHYGKINPRKREVSFYGE